MWGEMRMTPTDLSDVNAHTYTYLMNGATAASATGPALFRSGEKVRLRFINGSSMTYFDVRIPGLKMTVVAADGQYVHPVTVDEFRIAVAETFDVIVEPSGQDAFTIFAQDMGAHRLRSGTLAVRDGLRAPLPAARSAPDPHDGRHGHGGMARRHDMSATSMARRRRLRHDMRHAAHGRHGATRVSTPRARPAIRWSTCRPCRRRRGSTIPASVCATTAARC